MVAGFAAPALAMPSVAKVVMMIAIYLAIMGFLHHNRAFSPGLGALSKFAVASGIVSFWILASPVMAFAKGNVGPVIFAVLMAGFLASVKQRLKKRLTVQSTEPLGS
jgi:hypothetical protein